MFHQPAQGIVSSHVARRFARRRHMSKAKAISPNGTVAPQGVATVDPERLLGMEFIRGTEAAALSAYKWMGKGDKESADFAACDAIRGMFDTVNVSGTVTIGEGIKDDAPGIFKSEKLGTWVSSSAKMA